MITIALLFHLISCVILILVILLQSGKGADLAGAFGGAGTQTTFGPRGGATLLTRVTATASVVFMITSLALAILMSRTGTGSSVVDGVAAPVAPAAATAPAPVPAAEPSTPAAVPPADDDGFRPAPGIQVEGLAGAGEIQMKTMTKEEYEAMMRQREARRAGQAPESAPSPPPPDQPEKK